MHYAAVHVASSRVQVATSQLLKRVFRTALATGNALNAGTSHGGADGFRLETLLKLSNVKVGGSPYDSRL